MAGGVKAILKNIGDISGTPEQRRLAKEELRKDERSEVEQKAEVVISDSKGGQFTASGAASTIINNENGFSKFHRR